MGFLTPMHELGDYRCKLVETSIGKSVQRDVDQGSAQEDSEYFECHELEDKTATEND